MLMNTEPYEHGLLFYLNSKILYLCNRKNLSMHQKYVLKMTLVNIVVILFITGVTYKEILCSSCNDHNKNEIHLHKFINKSGHTFRYFYSSNCICLCELQEKQNLSIYQQIDLLIWGLHENSTTLITFTWCCVQFYDMHLIDEDTVLQVDTEYMLYRNISLYGTYNIQIGITILENKDISVKSYLKKLRVGEQTFSKISSHYRCTRKVYRLSQYLNVILYNESHSSDTRLHNTALFLIELLKYFPLNSLEEITVTLNIILKNVLPHFDNNLDLNFLKELDNLCHKLVIKQITLIIKHQSPQHYYTQVRTLSSLFIELIEFLGRNSEKLQIAITNKETLYNSTTTEDINLLMEIVGHLYDDRRLLADAVLVTKTTKGHTAIKSNSKGSETAVIKATGRELYNRLIDLQQVRIFTPKDFKTSDTIYNTVVSDWKENHAEHSPNKPNNLIDIEFQDSSTKQLVTTFKSPIHVFFDILKYDNLEKHVININFTVPTNLYKLNYNVIVDRIIIHAVEIQEMETLFVELTNFNSNHSFDKMQRNEKHSNLKSLALFAEQFRTDPGQFLQTLIGLRNHMCNAEPIKVVIRRFRVPDLWDFMENTTISANSSNSLIYRNDLNYPVIVYIGIIPNRNMLNGGNENKQEIAVSFDLKFHSLGCYSRNKTSIKWRKDCRLGQFTSSKMLHCKCHHLSVIYLRPSVHKTRIWNLMFRNRKLYLASSNGMMLTFGFLCILFICIGYIFGLGRVEKEVYYIPDNLWADRFAYLINIKTGFGRTAGTSSNVVLKLIGKHYSSRPHVLNFPDQENNILQRQSNNLFILTTEKYISQIIAIELWIDGRGHSPTWYCEYVKILDLQYESEWLFSVKKKLCYIQGASNWIRIKRTKENISPDVNISDSASIVSVDTTYTTAGKECSIKLSRHTMSFYARVTLGVSIMLTGYILAQFFYDFPSFEPNVVYNEYGLFIGYYYYIMTILAPFISFVIHSLLGFLFQNSASQFLDRDRYPTIFSFKVTCVVWFIITTLLLICASFVIFVDVYLPEISFYLWISCILCGILFQVCTLFNIYFMAGICFAFFKSSSDATIRKLELNNIIEETEHKRRYLHVTFSGNGLRPYLKHLYYPPKTTLRPLSIFVRELVEEWVEFFDNFIMIILYMFCLEYGFLIFTTTHMDLSRIFLNNILNMDRTPKTNTGDYNEIVIGLRDLMDRLMKERENAELLGNLKIQQVRVRQQACKLPKDIAKFNLKCIPTKLSEETEEVRAFIRKWILPTEPAYEEAIQFKYSLPEYTAVPEPISGSYGSIPGGGYMLYVSKNMIQNSQEYVDFLINEKWIDDHTIYLVFSGHLIDGNSNLIYYPHFVLHFDSAGYMTYYIGNTTSHLLISPIEIQTLLTCIFVVITIWSSIIVFKKMSGIVKQYTAFLQDFWTAIDMMVISSTIISYCMVTITMSLVEDYLMETNKLQNNQFLPYSHIYNATLFWDLFAALVIASIITRIFKLLRTFEVFKVIQKSFVLGAVPLASLLFCMAVVITSNAVVAYALFGVLSDNYETMTSTFFSLILLSFHYSANLDSAIYYKFTHFGETGTVFLVLYLVTTLMFYNIVKTVIIMSFVRAKQYYEEEIGVNYSSTRFISETFSKVFKKFRLSGGTTDSFEKLLITPKSNEFGFGNVLLATNNQLRYLKYASLCYIRNVLEKPSANTPMTDYDYKLMKKSVELALNKQEGWDDIQKFTKCKFYGEHQYHFTDDLKINDIKKCVHALLTPNATLEKIEILDTRRNKMILKTQKKLEAIISILDNFQQT